MSEIERHTSSLGKRKVDREILTQAGRVRQIERQTHKDRSIE